jgi:hypothetical protein
MRKKTKVQRYCQLQKIEADGKVTYRLNMQDKDSLTPTLANLFGTGVRLLMTIVEADTEPTRSQHVEYRVEILPWATAALRDAGNLWDEDEAHEKLKRMYWKVKDGEATPSLSDIGAKAMRDYCEWVQWFVSDFFGAKPPINTRKWPSEENK